MPTSGSSDFILTAREVIDFALKKLRVIGVTQTATAAQATGAQRELNLMLKGWQKYPSLWKIEQNSVALIANTASYILTAQDPDRVYSARYRNTSGQDLPMILLSREEYFDLPNKTNNGLPTQYYIDYQRDAPVLYVWPVPASVTTETIQLTSQRAIEDVDALDNDLDVKVEFLEVVGFNLASRLADDYGRTGEIVTRIIERAQFLLEEALDEDREDEVRFVPGYGYGW